MRVTVLTARQGHPVYVDLYRLVAELVTRLCDPTFAPHKLPVYAPFSFEAPGSVHGIGTNLAVSVPDTIYSA